MGSQDYKTISGTEVKGKEVVVLGRSKIVGAPASELFMWHHGTVTTCHSRTVDLASVARRADILIVAIGQMEMVKGVELLELKKCIIFK